MSAEITMKLMLSFVIAKKNLKIEAKIPPQINAIKDCPLCISVSDFASY